MSNTGAGDRALLLPGSIETSSDDSADEINKTSGSSPESSPSSTPPPAHLARIAVTLKDEKYPNPPFLTAVQTFLNVFHPPVLDSFIPKRNANTFKDRISLVCAADLAELFIDLLKEHCPANYRSLLKHPLTLQEFEEEDVSLIKIIVIVLLDDNLKLEKFASELHDCGVEKESITQLQRKVLEIKKQNESKKKTATPLDLMIQDIFTLINQMRKFSARPSIENLNITRILQAESKNEKIALFALRRLIYYFYNLMGFVYAPEVWEKCNNDKEIFFQLRFCYQIRRAWNIFSFLEFENLYPLATSLNVINFNLSMLDIFGNASDHQYILELLGGDTNEKVKVVDLQIKNIAVVNGRFILTNQLDQEIPQIQLLVALEQGKVIIATNSKICDPQTALQIRLYLKLAYNKAVSIQHFDVDLPNRSIKGLLFQAGIHEGNFPPATMSKVCCDGEAYERNYLHTDFDLTSSQIGNREGIGLCYRFIYGSNNLVGFAYFENGMQIIELAGIKYFDNRNILLSVINTHNQFQIKRCRELLQKLRIVFFQKGFSKITIEIDLNLVLKKNIIVIKCPTGTDVNVFLRLIGIHTKYKWRSTTLSATETLFFTDSGLTIDDIAIGLEELDEAIKTQLQSLQSSRDEKQTADILSDDDTSLLILAVIYEQEKLMRSILPKIFDYKKLSLKLLDLEFFSVFNRLLLFLEADKKPLAEAAALEKLKEFVIKKDSNKILALLKILFANNLALPAEDLIVCLQTLLNNQCRIKKELSPYYSVISQQLKFEFYLALNKNEYSRAFDILSISICNSIIPASTIAKMILDFLATDKMSLPEKQLALLLSQLIQSIYQLTNFGEEKSSAADSVNLLVLTDEVIRLLDTHKNVSLSFAEDETNNLSVHFVLLCKKVNLSLLKAVVAHTVPSHLNCFNNAHETPCLLARRKAKSEGNSKILEEIEQKLPIQKRKSSSSIAQVVVSRREVETVSSPTVVFAPSPQ